MASAAVLQHLQLGNKHINTALFPELSNTIRYQLRLLYPIHKEYDEF